MGVLPPFSIFRGIMETSKLESKKERRRSYYLLNKERKLEVYRLRVKSRREKWIKENGPCKVCGTWENLEVDHTLPHEKKRQSLDIFNWSEDRMQEELKKCQVLCYKHHKEKSNQEKAKGEACGLSKLTEAQVRKIRNDSTHTKNVSEVARINKVPTNTARDIIRRNTWKHLP